MHFLALFEAHSVIVKSCSFRCNDSQTAGRPFLCGARPRKYMESKNELEQGGKKFNQKNKRQKKQGKRPRGRTEFEHWRTPNDRKHGHRDTTAEVAAASIHSSVVAVVDRTVVVEVAERTRTVVGHTTAAAVRMVAARMVGRRAEAEENWHRQPAAAAERGRSVLRYLQRLRAQTARIWENSA